MKSPIATALAGLGSYADPCSFDKLRAHLPPVAITAALAAHATGPVRRGRLTDVAVLWLTVAMALFRTLSIEEVVARLRLARPGRRGLTVAPGTIPAARARLGAAPVRAVFEAVAPAAAHAHARSPANTWHGLALYGLDGSTFRVPDTPDNRATFGGHRGRKGSGESGYPLVRLVALMALASHLLVAVRFGAFATGEVTYARDLWAHIPNTSLTLVDRNFLSAALLLGLTRAGINRQWLLRLKTNSRYRVLARLGPGDWRVEITVSPEARAKDPSLPATFVARVVRYQRKGFRPQKLLTSLLDPAAFPAADLALVYHRRWELELGLAEIKTTMLERNDALRSKTPEGVRQEIWGLLVAYHLVRAEMQRVARTAAVDATRISFVTMLRRLRDAWFWAAVTHGLPRPPTLQRLWDEFEGLILRPRRPERCYPRAVKIKMSKFKRKRPVVRKSPALRRKAA